MLHCWILCYISGRQNIIWVERWFAYIFRLMAAICDASLTTTLDSLYNYGILWKGIWMLYVCIAVEDLQSCLYGHKNKSLLNNPKVGPQILNFTQLVLREFLTPRRQGDCHLNNISIKMDIWDVGRWMSGSQSAQPNSEPFILPLLALNLRKINSL